MEIKAMEAAVEALLFAMGEAIPASTLTDLKLQRGIHQVKLIVT